MLLIWYTIDKANKREREHTGEDYRKVRGRKMCQIFKNSISTVSP